MFMVALPIVAPNLKQPNALSERVSANCGTSIHCNTSQQYEKHTMENCNYVDESERDYAEGNKSSQKVS